MKNYVILALKALREVKASLKKTGKLLFDPFFAKHAKKIKLWKFDLPILSPFL